MNIFTIILAMFICLLLILVVSAILPVFTDYYALYKIVQASYQLSDWECFKMAFQDACSDVFNIESDEEVDD
jgi:hypothetical protein